MVSFKLIILESSLITPRRMESSLFVVYHAVIPHIEADMDHSATFRSSRCL